MLGLKLGTAGPMAIQVLVTFIGVSVVQLELNSISFARGRHSASLRPLRLTSVSETVSLV